MNKNNMLIAALFATLYLTFFILPVFYGVYEYKIRHKEEFENNPILHSYIKMLSSKNITDSDITQNLPSHSKYDADDSYSSLETPSTSTFSNSRTSLEKQNPDYTYMNRSTIQNKHQEKDNTPEEPREIQPADIRSFLLLVDYRGKDVPFASHMVSNDKSNIRHSILNFRNSNIARLKIHVPTIEKSNRNRISWRSKQFFQLIAKFSQIIVDEIIIDFNVRDSEQTVDLGILIQLLSIARGCKTIGLMGIKHITFSNVEVYTGNSRDALLLDKSLNGLEIIIYGDVSIENLRILMKSIFNQKRNQIVTSLTISCCSNNGKAIVNEVKKYSFKYIQTSNDYIYFSSVAQQ
ncbi:hypothetical protein NEFER03_0029 [Nematocida sp. LUAm3]|nr:hypothetical protein NEFER03_0029 [Nematocida sp. LUAm3]KAI5176245.1 hypothetical protein NEFER02_2042 [Nematocida sp. LUAm2]KAI5176703.1 hypothetical protein NEFER01_0028 [Nematocida sp. LUAm1]